MTKRKAEKPTTDAISIEGLTKSYGDLVALARLDLSVPEGQVVAIIGHNGSGKSTLLRLLAGLLDASDGDAEVFGNPIGTSPARAALSYLPDDPVLYDDLSVREHITYLVRLHGVDADDDRTEELLERLGLAERADELPARFSRGLRQKTSLVLGLIRPYRVLLVDEPFVGLDATGKAALLELLDEAKAAGATLLVATHELSFVERADRCVALRNGELIHDGPIDPVEVIQLVS